MLSTRKAHLRHAVTGFTLLVVFTSFSLAQHRQYDADDAFLPSPVRSLPPPQATAT